MTHLKPSPDKPRSLDEQHCRRGVRYATHRDTQQRKTHAEFYIRKTEYFQEKNSPTAGNGCHERLSRGQKAQELRKGMGHVGSSRSSLNNSHRMCQRTTTRQRPFLANAKITRGRLFCPTSFARAHQARHRVRVLFPRADTLPF